MGMLYYIVATIVSVYLGAGAGFYYKPMNNLPDSTAAKGSDTVAVLPESLTLFLCGDVMTGRGIDQVLPHSVNPRIYESYVKDARDYVRLAERKNGDIPKPVNYTYIWGDALKVWRQMDPDAKIINLETSVTTHHEPWPDKEVQYRMHPLNIPVLNAPGPIICSLANNHTLDWGRAGLLETMESLRRANIQFAGAGLNLQSARKPVMLKTTTGRVVFLAYGSETSGIPKAWEATAQMPGLNLLPDLSSRTVQAVADQVKETSMAGDVVVFSVHWGSNWGYEVPAYQQNFAHELIDKAGVDLVFGHSSHHPRGVEVYKNKLIIYGAGDFINDYEGIGGHEVYRGDLSLMYFPEIDPVTGNLRALTMVPMQIKRFRLNHASEKDAAWLANVMHNESIKFGAGVKLEDSYLKLVF